LRLKLPLTLEAGFEPMLYRAPPPACLAALQKRSKKKFEKSVLQVEFTLSLPLVARNLIFPLFFFFLVFMGKTALLRRAGQERHNAANDVVLVREIHPSPLERAKPTAGTYK